MFANMNWRSGRRLFGTAVSVMVMMLFVALLSQASAVDLMSSAESAAIPVQENILSAGGYHTCGLRPDGSVKCWGSSSGTFAGPFKQVSAGLNGGCGLKIDGSVDCFSREAGDAPGPFKQISTGKAFDCGLKPDGSVDCSPGETMDAAGPFTQISAGWSHICGLTPDRTVQCWGEGPPALPYPDSERYLQVAAGYYETCGLRVDGNVYCFAFGAGHYDYSLAGPFVQISIPLQGFLDQELLPIQGPTCGLKADGSVTCRGAIGNFNHDGPFTQISVGGGWEDYGPPGEWINTAHVCGLKSDGSVECWGNNDYGQSTNQVGPFGPYTPPIIEGEHLAYTLQQFADGESYTAVQLADMDYDGSPEVLIGNRDTDSLEIWQYNADLDTLVAIDSIGFVSDIHDIRAADFDDDGDMDIAAGLRFSGLYLATNSGAPGSVGSWTVNPIDGSYSWQVLVEDFDKDGNLDLYHGVDYGPIHTFYGDGSGSFAQGASIQDPATDMRFPRSFNAGDLDGDGRLDLIGVDGSFLRAFINPGNRSDAWASVGPTTPVGDYPCCAANELMGNLSPSAGDLDGNGFMDQVAFLGTPAAAGPLEVLLFEGSASGSDLAWTKRTLDTIDDAGWAGHAGVADLDGDGQLDIHLGGYNKFDGLRAYLGDGSGGFAAETVPLDHGVGEFNTFATGDLNDDGLTDIVTDRYTGSEGESSGFEVLFGVGQEPEEGDWQFECVDCPPDFGSLSEHSLQLDENGLPHIAFGGNYLYYSRNDGHNWQTEIVDDSPSSGAYASLALDANGRAHISYRSGEDQTLRYAYQTADGWQIEKIDSYLGFSAHLTSLALDSEGWPHIGYTAGDSWPDYAVGYARKSATGWSIETVAAGALEGQSLALDSSDRPHMSFTDEGALIYAYRDAGGWHVGPVKSEEAGSTSIALGAGDRPHISYDQAGVINYAHFNNGSWQIEIVDDGVDDLAGPALALDAAGTAHVAYSNENGTSVMYAVRRPGGWELDPNVEYGREGSEPLVSLALNANGSPSIAYLDFDRSSGYLRYSQSHGVGLWSKEFVTEMRQVFNPSLALDAISVPAISYYERPQGDLKYARWTPAGWTFETVDSQGDVGYSSALMLGSGGKAQIAYFASSSPGDLIKRLKYTYQGDAGWLRETVKTGPIISFSFAIDPDDNPHIVYVTETAGGPALTYAARSAAGWQREPIDAGDGYLSHVSLAVDSKGQPHISYLNRQDYLTGEDNEVRYGYRDVAGWHTQPVDANSDRIYFSTSLALDSDDSPHLVYAWANGAWIVVTYANHDGMSWRKETADKYLEPPETARFLPKLALGPDNRPHITYTDVYGNQSSYALRYGVRGNTGWRFQILDDWSSSTPALAIDPAGQPHLAYSNFPGGGGIRHAFLQRPVKPSYWLPMILRS